MTYERREEIFSKEYLTIQDVQELLGMSYNDAALQIRNIKRGLSMSPKFNGQGVRLDIQGKLHVQDYLDYFKIPAASLTRYTRIYENEQLKTEGAGTR